MNWDEYYMSIAEAVAKKSKDPSTQVGCILVSSDNRIVSAGYNGFIRGCDEKYMTFEKPAKDMITVHAEMNALIFAKCDLTGARAYMTHASCENCLKHLLQAGVREIVYKNFDTNGHFMTAERKDWIARLLKSTNAIYRNINGKTFFDEIGEK